MVLYCIGIAIDVVVDHRPPAAHSRTRSGSCSVSKKLMLSSMRADEELIVLHHRPDAARGMRRGPSPRRLAAVHAHRRLPWAAAAPAAP